MAAVTLCSDFGAQKNSLTLFPLFPHLFPMKWWDQFLIAPSNKRNQDNLETWLILELGQETPKLSLEYLTLPESFFLFK